MLKGLKNIEDTTDRQLEAIEEQEDKQLDIVYTISAEKAKGIEFSNERNKELKDLVEKN